MNDDERYLHDLESAAAALGALPDDYRVLRDLLASLPPGTAPVIKSAGTPNLADSPGTGGLDTTGLTLQSNQVIGSQPGGSLGILPQLFYGQSNALRDPLFEGVHQIIPIPLEYAVLPANTPWNARYIVNSGTPPTTRQWAPDLTRTSGKTNSDTPALTLIGFALGSTDFLIRSEASTDRGSAPFLVGAIRAVNLYSPTLTNITSVTMWIEIHDATGVILAASTPLDWLAFKAGADESMQLSTAYSGATTGFLVARIRVVASGAGGLLVINLGEPQLVRAAVQAPPPFSPIISAWVPPSLRAKGHLIGSSVIESRFVPEESDRFRMSLAGDMTWGPGTASQDTRLYRSGTKELSVDSASFGPVRVKILGPLFVQGPDAMALAITYGADGPTNIGRTDDGNTVASSVISYVAGKIASIVTSRFGKTITVTPTYTGSNITSVSRVVT